GKHAEPFQRTATTARVTQCPLVSYNNETTGPVNPTPLPRPMNKKVEAFSHQKRTSPSSNSAVEASQDSTATSPPNTNASTPTTLEAPNTNVTTQSPGTSSPSSLIAS